MAALHHGARERAITGLQVIGTGVAYYAVAQPGLTQLVGARGEIRFLSPAAGLALAALLLLGLKVWPGIALGSFFVSTLSVGLTPLTAVGIAAGSTLGVVLAYLLMRKAGFRVEMDRMKDPLILVGLAAIVGTFVGNFVRASVLVLSDVAPNRDFWPVALLTWMGSALGVLVVTPFLLVLGRARWPRDVRRRRVVEAVCVFVVTVLVMLLATMTSTELLFLVFPPLIWAAWRFQLPGSTPCVLVVAVIAVYAALHAAGPFANSDVRSDLITAQAFVASTALATLFLAVAILERNLARAAIENASSQIVDAVARLDQSLQPRNAPILGRTAGLRSPAGRPHEGGKPSAPEAIHTERPPPTHEDVREGRPGAATDPWRSSQRRP